MRIIQVKSNDGEYNIGLYATERTDNDQVDEDIQKAFAAAWEESRHEPELNPYDMIDEWLEPKGINRVFTDEVYVED